MDTLTRLRVFIASPGGLENERTAFRDVINEYNESDAKHRGVIFEAVGWEDTLTGVGRPQSFINADIKVADFFVMLLWNRWGSCPDALQKEYSSATQEEYYVAMNCYNSSEYPMQQLLLMFKSVDPVHLSDPGEQLQQVIAFREDLEKNKSHYFSDFETVDSLKIKIRKHLASWLRSHETGEISHETTPSPSPAVDPTTAILSSKEGKKYLPKPIQKALEKAWAAADKGHLTKAEVEFSKLSIGQSDPWPIMEFGRFLIRIGRLDQAQVMFEKVINISTAQSDPLSIAAANTYIGIVLQTRGDLAGAEQMHRKALDINAQLGQLGGMAYGYGNLGNVLHSQGDLDGAEQAYRKALMIDEKRGHTAGTACDYGNLGIVLHDRGDLNGAEKVFRKVIKITEKLEMIEELATAYGNLGMVLEDCGDLDSAEQMYRKSLEIERTLGRETGIASDYGNIGNVLYAKGILDDAEKMYRKAIEINEKLGKTMAMAGNYTSLGHVLHDCGDLDGAEQMYRKALAINEKLRRSEELSDDYRHLGYVLHDRNDLDGAEQMYTKGLDLAERLGSAPLIQSATLALNKLKDTLPKAEV
ncbi:MAG: tetratricopeptide repeat protein [Verrucomicrobia bacterium]|nr:tetratricopeptide repeat protein [Verrucomicrobiota bacterium]